MMSAWQAATARGESCVLVTVVGTRGSSYRSPGARMLILPDSFRIGAVSGGCLEGELCRRAFWWTSESAGVLKTFDTAGEDDNEGFGLGCGGSIDLWIERLPLQATETHPLLIQEHANVTRRAYTAALLLKPSRSGSVAAGTRFSGDDPSLDSELRVLLERAAALGSSFSAEVRDGELSGTRVFCESIQPPMQLLVCGAGNDAQPMVAQAVALGWAVIVLDKRADMARRERFPAALQVIATGSDAALDQVHVDSRTAAIVMSHSFAQDTFFLDWLLSTPVAYIGVLGSRRRTMDVLARLGHEAPPQHLHAPAGLDIGAETPEQIALSIASEIQGCFARRNGGHLRLRPGSIHGRELLEEDQQTASDVRIRECGLG